MAMGTLCRVEASLRLFSKMFCIRVRELPGSVSIVSRYLGRCQPSMITDWLIL